MKCCTGHCYKICKICLKDLITLQKLMPWKTHSAKPAAHFFMPLEVFVLCAPCLSRYCFCLFQIFFFIFCLTVATENNIFHKLAYFAIWFVICIKERKFINTIQCIPTNKHIIVRTYVFCNKHLCLNKYLCKNILIWSTTMYATNIYKLACKAMYSTRTLKSFAFLFLCCFF